MALSISSTSPKIFLFLIILPALLFSSQIRAERLCRFYVQVVREEYEGREVTMVPFVGADNTTFGAGLGFALNNRITEKPEYNSTEIGRTRGTVIITSGPERDNVYTSWISLNIVMYKHHGYIFTGGMFLFGVPQNDIAVVGGTGEFVGAEGIYRVVLLERYGPTMSNSVLQGDVIFTDGH